MLHLIYRKVANLIGVKMNTDSAQLFVQKMRDDKDFRDTVQEISDRAELWEYIENKGYAFDECELVKDSCPIFYRFLL